MLKIYKSVPQSYANDSILIKMVVLYKHYVIRTVIIMSHKTMRNYYMYVGTHAGAIY